MFSFAKSIVKTLEQSAESIIGGSNDDDSIFANDSYFTNAKSSKYGFRILKIDETSDIKNLESWFDYIIGINGHEIPTNYNEQYQLFPNYEYFIQEISQSKRLKLEVWNAKGGVLKYIELDISPLIGNQVEEVQLNQTPNFLIQNKFAKLGLSIQWTPLISSTFVYHILEIYPNSPAEKSGLLDHQDYIIGAQDGLLATGGEDLLSRVINSKKNQSLILYVYNHDFDIVRPITITPTDLWPGSNGSLLGCGIGYGLLHRLPPASQSNLIPGSVLFDSSTGVEQSNSIGMRSNDSFHPINDIPVPVVPNSASITTSGPPPIHGRKKKNNVVNNELLDYLNQESEKSRKLDDSALNHEIDTSLPPPPIKKTVG